MSGPSRTMKQPSPREQAAPLPTATPQQRVPRPMNAWLLFRTAKVRELKSEEPDQRMSKQQGELSKIIAEMWRNEDPATKQIYERLALDAKREHKQKYPDYKFAPLPKEKKPAKSRSVTPSSAGLSRTPSGRTIYDHPQWPRKRASSSSLIAAAGERIESAVAGPSSGPSVLAGSVQQLGSSTEGYYRAPTAQEQYGDAYPATRNEWTPTSLPPPLLPPPLHQKSHSHQIPYVHSHQPTAPHPQLYEPVDQHWFPAETSQRDHHTFTPPIPLLPPSSYVQPYPLSRRHTVSDRHDLYSHTRPTSDAPPSSLPFAYPSSTAVAPPEHYEYWAGTASNPLPVDPSQWPSSAPITTSAPAPSYFHPQEHHLANPHPPPPPAPQQPAPVYQWEGAYMVGGGEYIYSPPPGEGEYDDQATLFDRVGRRPSREC
ncbi:hypothetical protein BCR35DRAFT_355851 [Leucosporidium creatinivorum]|uniref:HMG box domain-containing protein n=1 Tax=Leucosporidium creatinivorum TaxID=106004 RepID=A0A1Y2D616_9BASI|nr:hypothetical protein BCR35DRAFT_355851 [Leucosporidium creatinivorum]